MKIFKNSTLFQKYCKNLKNSDNVTAFVPTMGCLHEGHGSLIEKSKRIANICIVSIFVNPLQFGPNEDFKLYPRNLIRDINFCKNLNVDILFIPSETNFYSNDFSINITENNYSRKFCGQYRLGHFDGVLTVVNKLLNLSMPDYILLGQKDYQQCILIKKLVNDMSIPVKVIICHTKREKNGLALSSRNKYLSNEEKEEASKIYNTLKQAKKTYHNSTENINFIKNNILKELATISGFKMQYLEIVDSKTLDYKSLKSKKLIILIAGFFGKTRLIDNILL